MKRSNLSDYARYILLADDSRAELKGDYQSFLNFKKVIEVVKNIASSDKSSYLYNGDIYSRKITSDDAKKIIDNVNQCRWTVNTRKLFLVASQLQVILQNKIQGEKVMAKKPASFEYNGTLVKV